MTDFINVLTINYDSSEYGGVPIFLINVFRNINHEKIRLDFLTPDTTSYNPWREEIEREGSSIYEFHINCDSAKGKLKFGRQLRLFLAKNPYDIVHVNTGALSFDCITAVIAKLQGAKVIIHSHNSNGRSRWKAPVAFFMKHIIQNRADVLCACSKEAAQNIYTLRKIDQGKVIIINNGIDLKKFRFNLEIRNKFREELCLKGHFVVGHVGRFVRQKNHELLVDIFVEILKREPTAILLMIGEGELESIIKEKVHNLRIEDKTIFLGKRDDVENLYQTMDVFLFPSLFEGLPITLVEAQMSGLPCCISDTISKEVDLTPLIHRVLLQAPSQEWAQETLAISTDLKQRCSHEEELVKAGYGIESTAVVLSRIYEELMQRKN